MNLIRSISQQIWKNFGLTRFVSIKATDFKYVHGISSKDEENRLQLQAKGAEDHLWHDINLKNVVNDPNLCFLEVGCGVGAQTSALLSRLPKKTHVLGIDIDPKQIYVASKKLSEFIPERVTLKVLDITKEKFQENSLSGAYISWVFEHISYDDSVKFLRQLKTSVKKGGIIINNEIIMDPDLGMVVKDANGEVPSNVRKFLNALVDYQKTIKGDANFGLKNNMISCYKDSNITNFIYRPIEMKYPKNDLPNSISYSKSLFKSVSKSLITSGFISTKDYKNALNELDYSEEIIWNSGQILAFTDDNSSDNSFLGIRC